MFRPGRDPHRLGRGENHWGGLATEACVKGDWLVALPETLSARQAMIIGTAGFTAMLCVDALVSAGVTLTAGISWSPAPAAGSAAPPWCC
ncbi:hypothetical protein LAD59_06670 [Klebsiella pneumoniae]|nr:hypothetical protein [Klebsiella pneumoniae]